MIYFHNNDHLVYLTVDGVERLFKLDFEEATSTKTSQCFVTEVSNIYFNEDQLVRRFLSD
jgi:hypothetical protein